MGEGIQSTRAVFFPGGDLKSLPRYDLLLGLKCGIPLLETSRGGDFHPFATACLRRTAMHLDFPADADGVHEMSIGKGIWGESEVRSSQAVLVLTHSDTIANAASISQEQSYRGGEPRHLSFF